MALTDLLQAIGDEADEELIRLEQETTETAASSIESARAEALALSAELAAMPEPAARRDAERVTALARLEAAAGLREAREKAFASVMTGVSAQLAAVRSSETYPDLLRALIAESRSALPDATTLRVDPRDVELARPHTGGLRLEPDLETWGGVELASDDGRLVRNTLEERLANAEPVLRLTFAHRLAAGSETPEKAEK
jgi:vacuolar-type H+-ATPase subunit E/Vma4